MWVNQHLSDSWLYCVCLWPDEALKVGVTLPASTQQAVAVVAVASWLYLGKFYVINASALISNSCMQAIQTLYRQNICQLNLSLA